MPKFSLEPKAYRAASRNPCHEIFWFMRGVVKPSGEIKLLTGTCFDVIDRGNGHPLTVELYRRRGKWSLRDVNAGHDKTTAQSEQKEESDEDRSL